MRRAATLLPLLGFLVSVDGVPNENGVEFLFPVPGLTLNYLDTINVTYTSPFPNPLLYTFCTNKTDTKKLIQKELIKATPYNASHLVTLNYKDVSTCYWNLRPNTSTGYGANSPSIKLLTEGRSSTTIGLPSGTQLPNPSTPADSNVPTDGSEAENGGGLSTGAKAGIGAGVAVAAVVIIAGVVFLLLKKRKSKASTAETIKLNGGAESGSDTNRPSYTDQSSHGTGVIGGYYDPKDQHKKLPEGDVSNPRELPGDFGKGNAHVFEMSGESRAVEAPNNSVKQSTK